MAAAAEELLKLCGRLSLGRPGIEMMIISKWLYKYKNMQRRDKAYQKLNRVDKDFKRYFNYDLHREVLTVVEQLRDLDSQSNKPQSYSILKELSAKVSSCLSFVTKYLCFIESTFSDLMQRIEIGHNIPMYIIVTSSLSRVWLLMKLYMNTLTETAALITRLLVEYSIDQPLDLPNNRILVNSGMSKSSYCVSGIVKLSDDLMKQRQEDFKNHAYQKQDDVKNHTHWQHSNQPRPHEQPTAKRGRQSKRYRLRRLVNTVQFIMADKGRRKRVIKVYGTWLARRVMEANRKLRNNGGWLVHVTCIRGKSPRRRRQASTPYQWNRLRIKLIKPMKRRCHWMSKRRNKALKNISTQGIPQSASINLCN